jgi:hypothetical protein
VIVAAMLLLIPPAVTPPIATASPDASSCTLLLPPQCTSLFLSPDFPSGALYATPAPGAPAPSSPRSPTFSTPMVSDHLLFWWSFQMPPIRWFQWLGGQDNIMVSESTAFSKAIMSILSIDRHQSSYHMSLQLCLQPPKVSTASH